MFEPHLPDYMTKQLAQIGVLPSRNFDESDEAPDLEPSKISFDPDDTDPRLDADGDPLF